MTETGPSTASDKIVVFTDGACSGNPGRGGWAAIVATPDGNVVELGGGATRTTNNQMEMLAAIAALRQVEGVSAPVVIHTDSTYLIKGITQWVSGWRRKGWKTANGSPVANRELWEDLLAVVGARDGASSIEWNYVRGHAGSPGNERVDEIAVAYTKDSDPRLFDGPRSEYMVDLAAPAAAAAGSERKSASKSRRKGPAFSYLSEVGGVVRRHRTWPECERRVKGQSGARFKKAMSKSEESEIVRAWGHDPASIGS